MAYRVLLSLLFSGVLWAQPRLIVESNLGTMIWELDEERAPATVANFLKYVQRGFYDDTIIHRVIPGFVIQGGGYDSAYQRKHTADPIANEAHHGLSNKRFTLAMARSSDPHSATSQFFINLEDNPQLDPQGVDPYGYAVFGRVVAGTEVLQRMSKIPTETRPNIGQDVPQSLIKIERIALEEALPQP